MERTYRGVKVVRKGVDDVRQVVSDLPDITEAPVLKSVSGGLSILESILGSREKGRDERGDMSNEAGVKGFRELDEGPAVAP